MPLPLFTFIPRLDEWARVAPEIVVAGCGLLLLIADLLTPAARKGWLAFFALLALAGGLAATITLFVAGDNQTSFLGMVTDDWLALVGDLIVLSAGVLAVLLSPGYIERQGITQHGEYYALLLFAVSGMMLMGSATNFMTIFLGLEILSLALYILSAFISGRFKSQEAGMKYFLLSSFASGFLLYGMALIYGSTGTTSLSGISAFLSKHAPNLSSSAFGSNYGPMLVIGMGLLAVGFLFKVSAIPFHAWTPDVYEGAPTSITAFMSVGTKTAAFVALARVFMVALHSQGANWSDIIWAIAILTMIGGNILAATQTNVKRMLAYSSIAHAGYILVGITLNTSEGLASVLFYLGAYAFMNIGAFGTVLVLERREGQGNELNDYAGLSRRQPILAGLLALFLLALAGFPGTVGFPAKWDIFYAAIRDQHLELAIIGLLASALGFFYYLRVIWAMYFTDGREAAPALSGALAAAEEREPVGAAPRSSSGTLAQTARSRAATRSTTSKATAPARSERAKETSLIQRVPVTAWIALAIAVLFTIGLGLYPNGLFELANHAAVIVP
ncbi:MAG TPA: NADH-quinone oxidoreductase subunit N [Ktedonobacterales bacterium]|nr:NADH-quinone oxidoreductase subunit N [Ktedonobacterales bacterium]